jgi:hypothetical protein
MFGPWTVVVIAASSSFAHQVRATSRNHGGARSSSIPLVVAYDVYDDRKSWLRCRRDSDDSESQVSMTKDHEWDGKLITLGRRNAENPKPRE